MNYVIPLPKFTAQVNIKHANKDLTYNYDGEMPEKLVDEYQKIIGDGLAKVTVTVDYSMKSYGEGVSSMCAVTLTCGQTENLILRAQGLAQELASDFAKQSALKASDDLKGLKLSAMSPGGPNYKG